MPTRPGLRDSPWPSARERRTRSQVARYLSWLKGQPWDGEDTLADSHARDFAARDYKAYLKSVRRCAPHSVNMALAAIDHLNGFLRLGPARCAVRSFRAKRPELSVQISSGDFCGQWSTPPQFVTQP